MNASRTCKKCVLRAISFCFSLVMNKPTQHVRALKTSNSKLKKKKKNIKKKPTHTNKNYTKKNTPFVAFFSSLNATIIGSLQMKMIGHFPPFRACLSLHLGPTLACAHLQHTESGFLISFAHLYHMGCGFLFCTPVAHRIRIFPLFRTRHCLHYPETEDRLEEVTDPTGVRTNNFFDSESRVLAIPTTLALCHISL